MQVGVLIQSPGGSRGLIGGGTKQADFKFYTALVVNTVEAANTKTANTHSGGGIQDRCPLFPGPLIAKNFCGSILADCFVLTPHNNQLRHCQRNTHRSRRPSSLSLHFLLPAEDLRNNGSTNSCVWNWWKYGLKTPTSVLSPLLQHHFKCTHTKKNTPPHPHPRLRIDLS